MIELRQLVKNFGRRCAVDCLDLAVPARSIFGLLGHNGAGKSTAIGMMLGQVWPDAGQIAIAGFDVFSQRSRALAKVGAIFETPVFYDYLSGWRNLEILATYSGPTTPARIREVLEWVGLAGREKSLVKTYSHGMRSRLALAQALLPGPEVLILDEPSDGLDPEGIHEMRQTILNLHRDFGLTIFLSSHLLNEVEQLCSHIAVMNQGRKVFEGTIAETRRNRNWARLRIGGDGFPKACEFLRERGFISASAPPDQVAIHPGVSNADLLRQLVLNGFAVEEFARQERTLEDFYLELMKAGKPPP